MEEVKTTQDTGGAPAGYHPVPGVFSDRPVYVANRWASEVLYARLTRDPATGADTVTLFAELEDSTLEEVRALIQQLTVWVETAQSGERYTGYRGMAVHRVAHYITTAAGVSARHREGQAATLCGVQLPPGYSVDVEAEICPSCTETVNEAFTRGLAAMVAAEEKEAQG